MPVMLSEADIAVIPARDEVVAPVLWVLLSVTNGQGGPSVPVTQSIEICPMTVGGVLVPRDADNNSTVKAFTVPNVFEMMERCPEYKAHIESGFSAILAVKAILDKDAAEAAAAAAALSVQ